MDTGQIHKQLVLKYELFIPESVRRFLDLWPTNLHLVQWHNAVRMRNIAAWQLFCIKHLHIISTINSMTTFTVTHSHSAWSESQKTWWIEGMWTGSSIVPTNMASRTDRQNIKGHTAAILDEMRPKRASIRGQTGRRNTAATSDCDSETPTSYLTTYLFPADS